MCILYVGCTDNQLRRVGDYHCNGGAASNLRDHIAKKMRRVGATANAGTISAYVKAGRWRFLRCNSDEIAKDFKGYLIEKLEPLLNVKQPEWDRANHTQYGQWLATLMNCEWITCDQVGSQHKHPGVHVFYHDQLPEKWKGRC